MGKELMNVLFHLADGARARKSKLFASRRTPSHVLLRRKSRSGAPPGKNHHQGDGAICVRNPEDRAVARGGTVGNRNSLVMVCWLVGHSHQDHQCRASQVASREPANLLVCGPFRPAAGGTCSSPRRPDRARTNINRRSHESSGSAFIAARAG